MYKPIANGKFSNFDNTGFNAFSITGNISHTPRHTYIYITVYGYVFLKFLVIYYWKHIKMFNTLRIHLSLKAI